MPKREKPCTACGQLFVIRRNPAQRYCSQLTCQRVRKNQWRLNRLNRDDDYRANQRQANQRWQKHHTDYWRRYRANHPDYQRRNREQQRSRDQRRRRKPRGSITSCLLAKSDAFEPEAGNLSGTYDLVPVNAPVLAKSDALRVKITFISNS
jgi:hypothetical protein